MTVHDFWELTVMHTPVKVTFLEFIIMISIKLDLSNMGCSATEWLLHAHKNFLYINEWLTDPLAMPTMLEYLYDTSNRVVSDWV